MASWGTAITTALYIDKIQFIWSYSNLIKALSQTQSCPPNRSFRENEIGFPKIEFSQKTQQPYTYYLKFTNWLILLDHFG